MSLLQSFQHYIKSNNLFLSKDKLLLAVSGGLDSIVLAALCRQSGFDCTMAHCNFNLRGEESLRDENFVRDFAKKSETPLLVKQFDTNAYALQHKVSVQVAARELRYQWFEELLSSGDLQLSYLLTAHHVDDNIETMLMNFFKGTGIAGMHGILPKQGKIVRPLLFAKKQELSAFAQQNDLAWVEDSSNESDKYTRNFFRHRLIPLIQSVFPAVEHNLADNIVRFREVETLYKQAIASHKTKLLEHKGEEVYIPVLKLKKTEPLSTVVYEIIKDFGFTAAQIPDVVSLLGSESGKYVQSSSHRVIKNRAWLIIAPNNTTQQTLTLIEGPGLWDFSPGKLKVEVITGVKPTELNSPSVALFNTEDIQFPLLLRKWKQGDYFYPLGMKGKKKKIARFLIDQKLSAIDKENTWVLEMNKKIIWVVGRRIDERFKVKENSQQLLRIDLQI